MEEIRWILDHSVNQLSSRENPVEARLDGPVYGRIRLIAPHGILTHKAMARRVSELPTWPLETGAMDRIPRITGTGVVAVVGRVLIDVFLFRYYPEGRIRGGCPVPLQGAFREKP